MKYLLLLLCPLVFADDFRDDIIDSLKKEKPSVQSVIQKQIIKKIIPNLKLNKSSDSGLQFPILRKNEVQSSVFVGYSDVVSAGFEYQTLDNFDLPFLNSSLDPKFSFGLVNTNVFASITTKVDMQINLSVVNKTYFVYNMEGNDTSIISYLVISKNIPSLFRDLDFVTLYAGHKVVSSNIIDSLKDFSSATVGVDYKWNVKKQYSIGLEGNLNGLLFFISKTI